MRITQIYYSSNINFKQLALSRMTKPAMEGESSLISQINEKPHLVEQPLRRLNLGSSYQTKKTASEDTLDHIAP